MVAALSRNDGLLNLGHELLAIHKDQSKTPEISQITSTDDLQHVDAPVHSLNPGFHQTQNPPHPHSPAADMTSRSYPAQHNSPNFAAVPTQLAEINENMQRLTRSRLLAKGNTLHFSDAQTSDIYSEIDLTSAQRELCSRQGKPRDDGSAGVGVCPRMERASRC
jgi:hypothetical protein